MPRNKKKEEIFNIQYCANNLVYFFLSVSLVIFEEEVQSKNKRRANHWF